MAVTVRYDQDSRMILSGLECSCGCEHHAVDRDIYIGQGLIRASRNISAAEAWARTACWWRMTTPGAWPA